ncbi:MAG: DHHW family protein [Agathobacter sp.]
MKITKLIMGGSLIVFLVLISVGSFVAKDREFSENENRYLTQFPEISIDSILNCDFQDGLEKYINDQIWGRDEWITIKTAIQKFVGNTDIGGAYVGKDGYDFEKITQDDVDQKLVDRNIAQIQEFFETASAKIDKSRLSFLLVPTSGLILADKLPANAPLFDQTAIVEAVKQGMADYNFVDIRDVMTTHKEEYVYYRTDHHWTSYGALLAYGEYCQSIGLPFDEESFKEVVAAENFRGSLYSKILDYDSAYDIIKFYEKSGSAKSFVVTLDGEKTDGFYHYNRLEEKDKYLFFFGGNYAEVVISNTSERAEKRNLLLIKDSFANCFAPLVAEDYDNVYMIDLRYFRGDMQEYMEANNITDVLVLYNVSNFISDKNIHKLN